MANWRVPKLRARPPRVAGVLLRAAVAASLVISLACQLPATAAPPANNRVEVEQQLLQTLRKPGDLTLRDTSLSQAIFTIGERWGINVVVGDDVEGKVNGVFHGAPLYEILDAILSPGGYGYYPVGNGLVVKRTAGDDEVNPFFKSHIITLRTAKPEDVMQGLQQLSSRQGKMQAIPSARSLLITDFPDRIVQMRTMAEQIDNAAAGVLGAIGAAGEPAGQLQMFQCSPQFIEATSLKESIATLLSKDGKLAVMELENRLIVFDYPASLAIVRQTVLELDVPAPQVRITALIYDVSLEDIEKIGVNWNHAVKWQHNANGDPTGLTALDTVTQAAATGAAAAVDPSGAMTVMNLSRHFDIAAVINLLKQANDARLLADPSVTVVNREQAKIQIVTEIPYQQLTQTQQGGNIGTTSFREAGVTMTVVPYISDDGTIQMVVTPSFSRLTGFTTGISPQPIIDKREAQTTVRVANGQMFVIGGLRQRTEIGTFTGIPYLMNLKLHKWDVGKLFRSRDTKVRESELIVFLRPEIVTPFDCGRLRERDALAVGNGLLESIPQASAFGSPHCAEQTIMDTRAGEAEEFNGGPYYQPQPGNIPPAAEVIPTPGINPASNVPAPTGEPVQTGQRPRDSRFTQPLSNGHRPWYDGAGKVDNPAANLPPAQANAPASSNRAVEGPALAPSETPRRVPAISTDPRQDSFGYPVQTQPVTTPYPTSPPASGSSRFSPLPVQSTHRDTTAPGPTPPAAQPNWRPGSTSPDRSGAIGISTANSVRPATRFGGEAYKPPTPSPTSKPAPRKNLPAESQAGRNWLQSLFR